MFDLHSFSAARRVCSDYLIPFLSDVRPRLADKLNGCGEFVQLGTFSDGSSHIIKADCCKDPLCPMCSVIRSRNLYGRLQFALNSLPSDSRYLLLTLTIPNVCAADLPNSLNLMMEAFRKFMQYTSVKNAVLGFWRSLEITYNSTFDSYHPHIHCLLHVRSNYFSSDDYILHEFWLDMWRTAVSDQKIKYVNIEAVKSIQGALAEVSKYISKLYGNSGLLRHPAAWLVVHDAIYRRRLVGSGGSIRQWLKVCDDQAGEDLCRPEELALESSDSNFYLVSVAYYRWDFYAKQYILQSAENICNPVDIEYDEVIDFSPWLIE